MSVSIFLSRGEIQPAVNDKWPGFVFGFHRKLTRTKTQQSTEKASEHNGAYSIFSGFGIAYVRINMSSVNSVLSWLSTIN